MNPDSTSTKPPTTDTVPNIEAVFDELEELESIVDRDEEREQVRETIRVLRRAEYPQLFGQFRDTFDSQDAGEAIVGSFVFGIPMVVEEGTLEIGRFIAQTPLFSGMTLGLGIILVVGILHAAEFEKVEEDFVLGVIPLRLLSIPLIAATLSVTLMTVWGRVDWSTSWIAVNQTMITAIVMAVGASIGDILPEP